MSTILDLAPIEYPLVKALMGASTPRYGQAGYPKPCRKDALWSPGYVFTLFEVRRFKS